MIEKIIKGINEILDSESILNDNSELRMIHNLHEYDFNKIQERLLPSFEKMEDDKFVIDYSVGTKKFFVEFIKIT